MIELNSYKMKLFLVGSVFIAYFVHFLVANRKGCSFTIHGKFEKNSPILLWNDTSLIVPSNGNVHLNGRQTITLICPDRNNFLMGVQSNKTSAQCVQGKILRVVHQDYIFDDLQCKKIIRGSVVKTARKCAKDKGRIYKIGHPTSPRFFLTLIEVCYGEEKGIVFYSNHILHGQAIKYASKLNYRPGFSTDGLGGSIAAAVAYKRTYQKATLSKLLRSSITASSYINDNSYLARGHLSPHADFLSAALQFTSYYYINTAPQWQKINTGNWKKLEGMVRKLAENLQDNLEIYTGVHETLKLADVDGEFKGIYLVSGNKLPVPRYIYKIVYEKKTHKAVVLVVLNDPFANSRGDLLCRNVCDEVGWASRSWSDYERGFVHCCDYREFVTGVETAPSLPVVGVLRGPK